ncbi:NifB/NifX family molybdenum-iron cluster-binding protein [uncultured Cohaesibacter sp.]|uniref:NifB/NifX family molybdenum-iron cluster-binding protein n=1 Tax=uncultured Cohaesibacter sp. TaxID=1002546 RepID=UPI0029C88304|nr:NifB/NifX family molybdenum-iron cluster-binding protein [uncultured Cohaesibacter sp.]
MKIAISTTGTDLSAPVEPKFGRTPYFLIFDTETNTFELIENTMRGATGGAGIKAAESIVKMKAQCVITGDCGPKALHALKRSGIKILSAKDVLVSEAIDLCHSNALIEL